MKKTTQYPEDIVSFFVYCYLEHWTRILGITAAQYLYVRHLQPPGEQWISTDILSRETELDRLFVDLSPVLGLKKDFEKLNTLEKEHIVQHARSVSEQLNMNYYQNVRMIESFLGVMSGYCDDVSNCICSFHLGRDNTPKYAEKLQYKDYNVGIFFGVRPGKAHLDISFSSEEHMILTNGCPFYEDLSAAVDQMSYKDRQFLICRMDDTNEKVSALTNRHLGVSYIEEIVQNSDGILVVFSQAAMDNRLIIKRSSFFDGPQTPMSFIPIRFKVGNEIKQFKLEHCFSFIPSDYSYFMTDENALAVSLTKVRSLPREGSLNALVMLLSDKNDYLSGFDYYQNYKKLHDAIDSNPRVAQAIIVSTAHLSKESFELYVIKALRSIHDGQWQSLPISDLMYWIKHIIIEEEKPLGRCEAAEVLLSVLNEVESPSNTILSIMDSLASIIEGGEPQAVSFDTIVQWSIELDRVSIGLDLTMATNKLKSSRPRSGRCFVPAQIKFPIHTLLLIAEGLEDDASKISKRKHYLINRGGA